MAIDPATAKLIAKAVISQITDEEKRQALLKKYERLETIISRAPEIQDIMVAGMQKRNGKYIVFCKDREDMIEKMEQVQEIFGKVNSKINIQYLFYFLIFQDGHLLNNL